MVKIINKTTRGGKRKGAGRKPVPYKTKTISFRVRIQHVEEIKKLVKAKIKELASCE